MTSAPVWRISGGRRLTPAPFLVAGIINLTPDSFSSLAFSESGPGPLRAAGSQAAYGDLEAPLALARLHLEQGAHILDLGAESTRPGARDIGHDEEWRRLGPALQALLELRANLPCPAAPAAPAFCISIDSFRAATARKALEARSASRPDSPPADIINDISGGLFDPDMDALLGRYKPGYVLCHCPARPAVMQKAPRYKNVLDEVESFFVSRLAALVKAGLPEECVVLDPGIGFGKSPEHNLALLRALPRFTALGRPVYLGLSRKSFLGAVTGLPLEGRGPVTAAAVALTAKLGASVQRVHDVGQAMAALKLTLAMSE
ncbi:dihydropteroate synthase [Desulfovibrio sp. OttesenSCG-928-G11]|nr:dihydropteroate synthase [Desulfovibrio sp. OttesenSCG-928-G11]